MNDDDALTEAVETLQQLGLKEYEAQCFVGLSQLSTGTAKQLSEITEVPRTRVYDAIRVLEAEGLAEVRHSSPRQFRAVPIEEAIETLTARYEERLTRLSNALETAEQIDQSGDETAQEVWSMTGRTAIANRTSQLTEKAEMEVVLVLGDESLLTEKLINRLNSLDSSIDLLIGAVTEPLQERIHEAVPDATTFLSGLEFLGGDADASNSINIGRLLLVDRSTILVSTITVTGQNEQAVFGQGFGNGLVVIARRLLSQGLIPRRDPERE